MDNKKENIQESARLEGRALACDGILRSNFGKLSSRAGNEALRKLRSSGMEKHRSRMAGLKMAAAAVAAVIVILILYSIIPVGQDEPDSLPAAENSGSQPLTDITAVLAQIGETSGEVKVRRSKSDDWLLAGALFNILPGDTMSTNDSGQARLDMKSGDFVYVNNDAEMSIIREEKDVLFRLDKGEIYLEKESSGNAMTIDTGFCRISARRGRMNARMYGKDKCLLHVFDGEAEYHRHERKGHPRKFRGRTRVWFRREETLEKGEQFQSEEHIQWALKMRPHGRKMRKPRIKDELLPGRAPVDEMENGFSDDPPDPRDWPPRRQPGEDWPPRRQPGEGRPPRRFPGRGGPRREGDKFGWMSRNLVEDFSKYDKDGDGILSPDELFDKDSESGKKILEQFDTDGDGGLSVDECKAMLEKIRERFRRDGPPIGPEHDRHGDERPGRKSPGDTPPPPPHDSP